MDWPAASVGSVQRYAAPAWNSVHSRSGWREATWPFPNENVTGAAGRSLPETFSILKCHVTGFAGSATAGGTIMTRKLSGAPGMRVSARIARIWDIPTRSLHSYLMAGTSDDL